MGVRLWRACAIAWRSCQTGRCISRVQAGSEKVLVHERGTLVVEIGGPFCDFGVLEFSLAHVDPCSDFADDPPSGLDSRVLALLFLIVCLFEKKNADKQAEEDDEGADNIGQEIRELLPDRSRPEDAGIILHRICQTSAEPGSYDGPSQGLANGGGGVAFQLTLGTR
ncbi:hypothetical protein FH972_023636 [Carpinus fangiana]|uniref:Uncharacterized protein n=1 Tax=Carpinus fangiana TaxID=176857 RepID=A0A5N6KWD3_9ROSI|nr:hypothetical protein FH972_023636 [Carpinus fangiana]